MNWEKQTEEEKTRTLRAATSLFAGIHTNDKSALARNSIMMHTYQAMDILGLKGKWQDDTINNNYQCQLIIYLLTIGEFIKGDVYGYAIKYIQKAIDYIYKVPTKRGQEELELDFDKEGPREDDDDDDIEV